MKGMRRETGMKVGETMALVLDERSLENILKRRLGHWQIPVPDQCQPPLCLRCIVHL